MNWYQFFIVTLLIQLILKVVNIWVDFRYWLISVGLDPTYLNAMGIFKRNISFHSIDSLGRFVGSIIGAIIIFGIWIGLVKKRKWAIVFVIISSVLGLFTYIGGVKSLISFYSLLSKNIVWPGYFIFGGIIIINVTYSIAVTFFFSKYLMRMRK